jgi:hypothetical protein
LSQRDFAAEPEQHMFRRCEGQARFGLSVGQRFADHDKEMRRDSRLPIGGAA